MVIASGTSSRHLQALSEILVDQLKKLGINDCRIEGKNSNDWKLVDAHDEIRGQISIHHQEGEVKKGDRDMLGGILDLPDVNVEDVMVHRKNITAININEIDESKITEILSSPYTRIPVWEESTDNFIGLLHIKSLIKEAIKSDNDLRILILEKFCQNHGLFQKQLV